MSLIDKVLRLLAGREAAGLEGLASYDAERFYDQAKTREERAFIAPYLPGRDHTNRREPKVEVQRR